MSSIGVEAIEGGREMQADREPFTRAAPREMPPPLRASAAAAVPTAPAAPHSLQEKLAALGPARPLPPPLRPARQPSLPGAEPTSAASLSPRLTPDAIVRALGATNPALDLHPDDRPPMIIERAMAERDFPAAASSMQSPWPPLLTGFAASLLVGAALYWTLASL